MIQILIMCTALVLCGMVESGWPQSPLVPLDHWSYRVFDRFVTAGHIMQLPYHSYPRQREEGAVLLSELQHRQSGLQVSRREQALLRRLYQEWSDTEEITYSGTREPHLYTFRDSTGEFFIDIYAGLDWRYQSVEDSNSHSTSYTTAGAIIRGKRGTYLSFYLDFRNTLISGEEFDGYIYNASQGLPITRSGKNAYSDQAVAVLRLQNSWGAVELGRNAHQWGPGYNETLALSAGSNPYDYVKLQTWYRFLKFQYIHASLRSDVGNKYLAAHRLEVRPLNNLIIGGYEAVVYSRSAPEFVYLNPIVPFHIAEHHQGDKDNNVLGFDWVWRIKPGYSVYGEVLIDDMNFSKNLTTWYGNKWGLSYGLFLINPFHIPDSEWRFEYRRIDPWVYTHTKPVNSYTHYNFSLGSSLPPNSESWFTEWHQYVRWNLRIAGSVEFRRSGEGSLDRPHTPDDPDEKNFLAGTVEKRTIYQGSLWWEVRRDVYFTISGQYHTVKNRNLIPHRNNTESVFRTTIYVNY